MAGTKSRISRERKELISQYATAAVSLYGVISAEEFVAVFNHYEEAHTTVEEAMLALVHLARTDDVEYSVFGEIISRPEFQPESDDYEDSVGDIRRSQRGKPHYLPSKEEFLKYLDFGYREPEEPYAELKAYILKHKLNSRREGLSGVDGNMLDLHAIIQSGATIKHELDYFQNARYRFKDLREVQEFLNLVTNVHNHTRRFQNNGFTPNEIFEIQNRTRWNPTPKKLPKR
jgi:hypothetical protein